MENSSTLGATLIPKEEVAKLKFPSDEVISSNEERLILYEKLKQATVLGNIDHSKIRIIFQDDQGRKMIETTIWATGEKNIVLKHGMTIPIRRILDIQFH
jgi:uncharacterized protein (UPF0248 family)